MNLSVRNLSLVFMAGLVGGLLNGLAIWFFGLLGIPQILGVQIAPPLTSGLFTPSWRGADGKN